MGIFELIFIAVGLSMDAFAVSICKGLSMKKMSYKNAVVAGCFFGGFQALMPIIGYILGVQFKQYITKFDHWVAFALLTIIGIKMIWEAHKPTCPITDDSFGFKNMTAMAVATSIDALAVGVTFAFFQVKIVTAASIIGIITFIFSFTGVKIGHFVGAKFESKAEYAGGFMLIAIGIKILADHLMK